jgi:hypothetical protein
MRCSSAIGHTCALGRWGAIGLQTREFKFCGIAFIGRAIIIGIFIVVMIFAIIILAARAAIGLGDARRRSIEETAIVKAHVHVGSAAKYLLAMIVIIISRSQDLFIIMIVIVIITNVGKIRLVQMMMVVVHRMGHDILHPAAVLVVLLVYGYG